MERRKGERGRSERGSEREKKGRGMGRKEWEGVLV